jgi:hypothetical protein
MPSTTDCVPCCSEPVVTNVPGTDGDDGDAGTNGVSSFTTTTADFVIPAVGATVTVAVVTSAWIVLNQNIVFEGPATFQVTAIPGASSVTVQFLGYALDLAPGITISSGVKVGPAGSQPALTRLSVYAAGTAYQLTNTAALLNFGTTDPSLTITSAGTWLILARVRYDYNAATFAAVRTVTTKLRRTNNTAADLTNGSSQWLTEIITTLSYTAMILDLQPIVYTTTSATDVIEIFGDVNTVPSAGSLDAVEACILAIKLT